MQLVPLVLLAFALGDDQPEVGDEASLLQLRLNQGRFNRSNDRHEGETVESEEEEEAGLDLAEVVRKSEGCSRRRGRRRRRTLEYDCWQDCGCKAGFCDKCGVGRACCRLNYDNVDACKKLTEPAIHDRHFCRDTLDTPFPMEYSEQEWNCWSACGEHVGPCRACGPFGVCCHPEISHEKCEDFGPFLHPVCRRPGPEAAPSAVFHVVGQWQNCQKIPSSKELTYGKGWSGTKGGSTSHTTWAEFTAQVETGLSWGMDTKATFSMAVGYEYSVGYEWEESEETWTEETLEFAKDDGEFVWQWVMSNSEHLNDYWESPTFAQTANCQLEPACLAHHTITNTGSQLCNYGYRLDGTGGDVGWKQGWCHGRPTLSLSQMGRPDRYRGWYDVSGCGHSLDYCRWTGGKSRGNPQHTNHDGLKEWQCLLSSGEDTKATALPGWDSTQAGRRPVWKRDAYNAPDCGHLDPVPEENCHWVAQQLGFNGDFRKDSWNHIPSGCSVNINGISYYNTKSGGEAHSSVAPVCLTEKLGEFENDPEVPAPFRMPDDSRVWNFKLFESLIDTIHLGAEGEKSCDTKSVSEIECLEAAQALLPEGQLQGSQDLRKGTWEWVPKGCSLKSGSDWSALYNSHSSGGNSGGYTPVCAARPNNHLGNDGDKWCTTESVSEDECLEAARALVPEGQSQGSQDLRKGSWHWVPQGCSLKSGDWSTLYNSHGSGGNSGDYLPVCTQRRKFHLGVEGGNSCTTSHPREEECLLAAQELLPAGAKQERTHLVVGSWGWVPPGCSLKSGGDWAALYNHGSGSNDGKHTPVCTDATPYVAPLGQAIVKDITVGAWDLSSSLKKCVELSADQKNVVCPPDAARGCDKDGCQSSSTESGTSAPIDPTPWLVTVEGSKVCVTQQWGERGWTAEMIARCWIPR